MNIYDIRKSKLVAKSEQQDDELLSIAVVKNNKKVVVGTQDGTLLIFTWGQWLDCTDRLPGHPSSINSLLPISSDCIVTGADDGIMRLIGIIPNKLIGVVGLHVKGSGIDFLKEDVDEDEDRNGDDDEEGFPVEKVKSIPGTNWIASSSHDEVVRFWDVGWVHETDELPNQVDEGEKISDDEGESEEEKQTVRKKKSRKKAKRGLELPKQNLFADLD
ncbi:WD domain repeat-containing protein 55 [Nowakowskiella sp. JEL0407]|nr:WD domain repeat-containing protein 55 [Nowakowskiella sp. JEL0407]